MKTKTIILSILVLTMLSIPAFFCLAADNFDYKLLESLPGSEEVQAEKSSPGFNAYISAIYKFALWAVGISALLMISIGAFMYLTSAGNNAAMGKAKGVITDALIGLFLALVAWLLLYTINPELISPKGISGTGGGTTTTTTPTATSSSTPPTPTKPTTVPTGTLTQAEAQSKLEAENIKVVSTKTNPDGSYCLGINKTGCTDLNGIHPNAINNVVDLKKSSSANFTINGGTETSGHTDGTTHRPGNATLDIQAVSDLDQAILSDGIQRQIDRGLITKVCGPSGGLSYKCSYNENPRVFHIEYKK